MILSRTATATAAAFTLLLAPVAFAEEGMKTEKQEMKTEGHQHDAVKSEKMKNEKTTNTASGRSEMAGSSMKTMKIGEASVVKASDLIGYSVTNAQGDSLGKIEDIVIDPGQGRIAYAVLSFGGFLGMGDKLFAIPWESLSLKADEQTLLLAVEKEKLQKAPGFDKAEWPNMASREWGTSVHQYYNQKPYWESNSTMKSPTTPPSMGASQSMGEPSQRRGTEGTEGSPMREPTR
ncbi:MAG: PRC-barrel domain-containing protein [Terriglobia bacterium]